MTIAMIIMITTSLNGFAQDGNYRKTDTEVNHYISWTDDTSIKHNNPTELRETNQKQTFRSAFDTFVNSEPQGYGIYDEKESNVFRPRETLILYVEPFGYNYENTIDEKGNTFYTIKFNADLIISDSKGNILEQQDIPINDIISHKQIKKYLFLLQSLSQLHFHQEIML